MTRSRATRVAAPLLAAALLVPVLAACTPNDPAPDGASGSAAGSAKLTVDSSADACTLSATEAPSGNIVFTVTNTGDDVTEFYLLAEDGLRIVSEVENIGPGISRDLVLTAKAGQYVTACKPGMIGDGIRSDFTVTDSGKDIEPTGAVADQIALASTNYVAYVKDQTEQLLEGTQEFVTAYKAGDDEAAKALYAPVRVHWERIEPVAESFGDLDPKMDLREADLEEGQEWTGWHLLEKDLWQPAPEANGGETYVALTPEQRAQYADQLLADTQELFDRTHEASFADGIDAPAIGNGAKVAYDGLRDVVSAKDEKLATTLDERFQALQGLLDEQRQGDGFVLYTDLTPEQVKALSQAVDSLSEPLSQLTAAVVL